MKKFLSLLAALLLSAPLLPAAQPDDPAPKAPLSRFSLGAFLSYWNASDLDDLDLDGAFGGGLVGQFRLARLLALELRLSGFAAGSDDDVFVPGEGWYDTDTTLVAAPLEAGLVAFLPLGDKLSLYGGPGAGYYFFDGEIRSEQGPIDITCDLDLDDEPGFYLLAGARAQLARNAALFCEAKYTWVETSLSLDRLLPDSLPALDLDDEDIDFSGLSLQAGMLFTF